MKTPLEQPKTPEKPRSNKRKITTALALTAALTAGTIVGANRISDDSKKKQQAAAEQKAELDAIAAVNEANEKVLEDFKDTPTSVVMLDKDGGVMARYNGTGLLLETSSLLAGDAATEMPITESEALTFPDPPTSNAYYYNAIDDDGNDSMLYFEVKETPYVMVTDDTVEVFGVHWELCSRDGELCAPITYRGDDGYYRDASRDLARQLILAKREN
ncbi:hypothetical protein KBD20_00525 [Candidatus Saccharibacteria bacterium]|nr:hypothetical protein [Candidatus Saccharibacteria bacterium]